MALNYEFDVFSVTSSKVPSGPVMHEMMTELDLKMENKVARFRSQVTIDALKVAERRMRRIFRSAGFEVGDVKANPKDKLFDDKEAHAVFLVRVTDGIEKNFSEKELDLDDILARPSVDAAYDEGIEPEGAFVVLDWLNDTIAMHEMADGDIGEDDLADDEFEDDIYGDDTQEAADVSRDVLALSAEDAEGNTRNKTKNSAAASIAAEIRQYSLLTNSLDIDVAIEKAPEPTPQELSILEASVADVMAKDAQASRVAEKAKTEAGVSAAPLTRFKIIPSAFDTMKEHAESLESDPMGDFAESDLGLAPMADNHNLEMGRDQIDLSMASAPRLGARADTVAYEVSGATPLTVEYGTRRLRKPVTARRVRVLEVDQVKASRQVQAEISLADDEPKVSHSIAPITSLLERFNSPVSGVLAGLAFSGAGILLISQVLA